MPWFKRVGAFVFVLLIGFQQVWIIPIAEASNPSALQEENPSVFDRASDIIYSDFSGEGQTFHRSQEGFSQPCIRIAISLSLVGTMQALLLTTPCRSIYSCLHHDLFIPAFPANLRMFPFHIFW